MITKFPNKRACIVQWNKYCEREGIRAGTATGRAARKVFFDAWAAALVWAA